MGWLDELIKNLPQILAALSGNINGLIALIWAVAAVALLFIFKNSPSWMRALLFIFALGGTFYLVRLVIGTNNDIIRARISGYVYYEVDAEGKLTPNDGRIYALDPTRRQYGELRIGDQLKTAEAARLYSVAHKDPARQIAMTEEHECLTVTEIGHPVPVKQAASGGWLGVRPIPCT